MSWWLRKRWRIAKHWWFISILGWQGFNVVNVQNDNRKVTYQCYGYVCQVEITVTVEP